MKRNGKKGKGWEKRQRNISQKGVFLTQESRKGAERGFSARTQETGAENAVFRLTMGMSAGRRIFLHFRFPFALVNMGRVVNHISPFFSPSPS